MSEFDNDFSHQPVPDNKTVSSKHIALVIIGGTIAIPAFLMSAQISSKLGFVMACLAFFCGAIILGIMNACTSWIGSKTHLSASMLTENAFGKTGAKLVNGIMALTLIGWYGVNCKMFADAADTVLSSLGISLSTHLYVVIGSALMLWISIKGFKGIDKLALWLVPMMSILIIIAAYLAIQSPEVDRLWVDKTDLAFSSAISAVVGTYIVGVVIQPDYSRFAKSHRGASMAAGLSLLLIFPLVLVLTSIPVIISQQVDLILVMIGIGIGMPAFFLLLLSSWSSNVLCLYSSSLSISTITPKYSLTHITLFIGVIGTLIAFVDIQKYFIDFLIILGISIPPIGAIYCVNYWLNRYKTNATSENTAAAIFAWCAGCLFGYLSYQQGISITQVESLDAILAATVTLLLCNYKHIKRAYNYKEKP